MLALIRATQDGYLIIKGDSVEHEIKLKKAIEKVDGKFVFAQKEEDVWQTGQKAN